MFTMIMMRMMIMAPIMAVGGIIMAGPKDAEPGLGPGRRHARHRRGHRRHRHAGAFPSSSAIQVKIDRINLVLREGLTGVRVIRAFNRVEHETEALRRGQPRPDRDLDPRATGSWPLMMPLMMLLMNLTTIAIIWFGAKRIDLGEMQRRRA